MDVTQITKQIVAIVALSIILSGGTIPDKWFDMFGSVSEKDMQDLGGMMVKENGDNGDKCLLLTGSVALNRLYSKNWYGSTIEEVIRAKGQYARTTVRDFQKVKIPERTKMLTKYLLIFGPICPSNVVYQGQKINGKGIKDPKTGKIVHVYERIEVPGQKDELFCYE